MKRNLRVLLPLLAVLAVLVALGPLITGCRPEEKRDAPATVAPGTPVVLISVDTLRSDRLPAYGYERVATPAVDRLRRDGILFTRAFSPVPLTLPAHVSLLTGLLPYEHRVRDNIGYRLPTEVGPYLPALLRDRGYATAAGISAFVLRGDTGMERGFDLYSDEIEYVSNVEMGGMQRSGGQTLRTLSRWLERRTSGSPFFLFFHLYEPHAPYQAPEPFASRYESAYDGEVAAADAVVGELLAELDRLGLYDESLVLFLSDHGEGLRDHGEQEHGILLYREAIQVPLILKLPGAERAGDTVDRPVSLVDVVPTLLALLGQEVPEGLPGRSLLEPEKKEEPRILYAETHYPRIHFGWGSLLSAVGEGHHLIQVPDADSRPELYDLEQDPAETEDVLADRRGIYVRLRDRLRDAPTDLEPPAEADAETRRALATLGYVGNAADREAEGPLPHPKTRLPVLEELGKAYKAYLDGDPALAAERFRAVLEKEPRLVDAWENLGLSLRSLGRLEESWEAYERALELSGGSPPVALSAATVLLRLGRLEEARHHAELAATTQPFAHALLARIDLREQDLESAEEHARKALEVAAGREAEVHLLLAKIQMARKDFKGTLESLDASIESREDRPALEGTYLLQGRARANLGHADRAEEAFRRSIELDPEELAAYSHLALLYALEGQGPRTGGVLQEMVEENPTPAAYAEAVRTLKVLGDARSAEDLLRRARSRWPGSPELEPKAVQRPEAPASASR